MRRAREPLSLRFTCALAVTMATGGCSTLLGLEGYVTHPDEVTSGPPVDAGLPGLDTAAVGEQDAGSSGLDSAATDANADAAAPGIDSAAAEAQAAADADADAGTSCDADLATQCYPCAPSDTLQFLNACTNATCMAFDDVTRLTKLLADGGLPPLPPVEAGAD